MCITKTCTSGTELSDPIVDHATMLQLRSKTFMYFLHAHKLLHHGHLGHAFPLCACFKDDS